MKIGNKVCWCTLAGTSACEHCITDNYGKIRLYTDSPTTANDTTLEVRPVTAMFTTDYGETFKTVGEIELLYDKILALETAVKRLNERIDGILESEK